MGEGVGGGCEGEGAGVKVSGDLLAIEFAGGTAYFVGRSDTRDTVDEALDRGGTGVEMLCGFFRNL